MNRIFFVLLAILTITGVSGCKSSSVKSLERGRRRPRQEYRTTQKNKKSTSADPLFDTVFKKSRAERQRGLSSSLLNEREQKLINDARRADDSTFSAIRERNRKTNQKQSDWVYGTTDGKYFKRNRER